MTIKQLTKEQYMQYIGEMLDARDSGDIEKGHAKADDILCSLLRSIGLDLIVNIYEEIDKWYA